MSWTHDRDTGHLVYRDESGFEYDVRLDGLRSPGGVTDVLLHLDGKRWFDWEVRCAFCAVAADALCDESNRLLAAAKE